MQSLVLGPLELYVEGVAEGEEQVDEKCAHVEGVGVEGVVFVVVVAIFGDL